MEDNRAGKIYNAKQFLVFLELAPQQMPFVV